MMITPYIQTIVDLNAFCDTAKTLSGVAAATAFSALKEYATEPLTVVDWSATGSSRQLATAQYDKNSELHHRFLQIKANTHVQMTCGRCLSRMSLPLSVNTWLQVYQAQAAADAAAMHENADTMLDPIVSSKQFNLLEQIQEELLLNLPNNPIHDQADTPCAVPATINNQSISAFAVLKDFKNI